MTMIHIRNYTRKIDKVLQKLGLRGVFLVFMRILVYLYLVFTLASIVYTFMQDKMLNIRCTAVLVELCLIPISIVLVYFGVLIMQVMTFGIWKAIDYKK